ncbi:MAG: hypothetical protein ACRDHW_17485, partial [Ktedonobacteraceae bacterium]
MNLTEAKFAESQGRVKKDREDDEDTQKMPVVKQLYKTGNWETDFCKKDLYTCIEQVEQLKERPVTTRKDAPDTGEPQAGINETGSLTVQENTLAATGLPVENTPVPG